jgi:hypothetical protein
MSLLISSCTTRLRFDSDAPALPASANRRSHAPSRDQRLTDCLASQERKGLTITRIRNVETLPSCGMDLIGAMLTLCLIPHSAPEPMEATVEGTLGGKSVTRTYGLWLTRHTSIWHWLVPRRYDERAIARAILSSIDHDYQRPSIFARKPSTRQLSKSPRTKKE